MIDWPSRSRPGTGALRAFLGMMRAFFAVPVWIRGCVRRPKPEPIEDYETGEL